MKQVLKTYSRFEKLVSVFLCVVLIGSLVSLYLKIAPNWLKPTIKSGNVLFSEGLYGSVQKLNPLYTDFNPVDQDISQLIFCSLSSFDPEGGKEENGAGGPVESIATHTLDEGKTVYTFTIKPGITWHDGVPVTADDVMFTYKVLIQNEKFQNHILKSTFADTEIKKVDERTVQFLLKSPNSFFFSSTIVGLLPYHILKDVSVETLSTHEFNTKPVGCGPFQFDSMVKEDDITQVRLKKFDGYFEKGGDITQVVFYVYPDFSVIDKYKNNLHGIARIPQYAKESFEDDRFEFIEYTLPQYTALFINTESAFLKSNKTRLGIKKAIEKQSIVDAIGYTKIIDTPLLELSQDDWINRSNTKEAMGSLFDAGWKFNYEKGVRVNDKGELLHLRLVSRLYEPGSKAEETTVKVVRNIELQLQAVGIKLKIIRLPLAEFEETLAKRDYDLLLYGQSMGYNLDTYSFWHSSQSAGKGLNLSNYGNPQADSLIEYIRHDFDPETKQIKLEKLAEILSEDVPAVFLYTPTYYYALDKNFNGAKLLKMATPTDRLSKLHLWKTR